MYIEKIHIFTRGQYDIISLGRYMDILASANSMGFDDYKLEKDFILTLLLIRFSIAFPELIFKGGTCLNKVYFPYFRLSEDLDFMLSHSAGRDERQKILRKYEDRITFELERLGLRLQAGRNKYDEHRLALLTYEYQSVIDSSIQTIKIDISLKGELLIPPVPGRIHSLFRDRILELDLFGSHSISCIDIKEALAEKMRAALTRSIPAIRDFFDIWYIRRYGSFDFDTREFSTLLSEKLREVDYQYTIDSAYELLERQIETDLRPVLHEDFDFSLREIYDFVITQKQ